MKPNREQPSIIGRESPLARVRSRARAAVAAATGGASRRTGGRRRHDAGEPRPLSRREEATLKALLAKPIDYIDSEVFRQPDAETYVYGLDEVERQDTSGRSTSSRP